MTMIDRNPRISVRIKTLTRGLGLGLALVVLISGCGRRAADSGAASQPQPTSTKPAGPVVIDYQLRGVVRSLSKETGRVMIKHRAIPGFMGAMTMPFKPADPGVLETLQPGDEVVGTLRVFKEDDAVKDYQLLDLKVTQPAEPPTKVLDLSRGKVVMREQPRRLEPGNPVPNFTMTGQDGGAFQLSDLRGRVIVLTFVYTRCPMPDFCPLMDGKFSKLAQRISSFPGRAKDVRLISLSFDPEHDTPEVLRKHAQIRGAIPPLWTYAVASHPELSKVAGPLGLFYSPDGSEISHNLCTAVIDPQGNLARLDVGTSANRWETADLLKTISSLIPRGNR